MAGLSAPRSQHQQGYGLPSIMSVPQKGSTTIYAGALVMLDGGYAAPGATATGKLALGMADETSVNSGSDGAVSVRVRTFAVFRWDVTSGDEPAQADVGKLAYVTYDHEVGKTSTSKSAAGLIMAADGSTYCDVLMFPGINTL